MASTVLPSPGTTHSQPKRPKAIHSQKMATIKFSKNPFEWHRAKIVLLPSSLHGPSNDGIIMFLQAFLGKLQCYKGLVLRLCMTFVLYCKKEWQTNFDPGSRNQVKNCCS